MPTHDIILYPEATTNYGSDFVSVVSQKDHHTNIQGTLHEEETQVKGSCIIESRLFKWAYRAGNSSSSAQISSGWRSTLVVR
ncbi:hypothetical protein RSOLAG1IB_12152 [Rhizoctonia solani AG-1 IB]|uniref:Uncharacterized protein n=1 Tax=Thanatephorus cucumeris (strain AG1-IB / isolate 7/3/14) TaxID=1108050 RepID=A0A0B7FKR0_THACB|nr:hypothetical protein RSOLAG1IB_12152 [Rhizoctonia solani AG-1 IB]